MHGTIDNFDDYNKGEKPLTLSYKQNTGLPAGTYTGEWDGLFVTLKSQSGRKVIQYRFRTVDVARKKTPVTVIISYGYGRVYAKQA